jgi:hypothetical protein
MYRLPGISGKSKAASVGGLFHPREVDLRLPSSFCTFSGSRAFIAVSLSITFWTPAKAASFGQTSAEYSR